MPAARVILLCVGLAMAAWPAYGQPVRGIVWEPPLRTDLAEEDLLEMHAMGVQAIRSPLIRNERLYRVADSLGIAFYQDLPFQYLAGGELRDTLRYAEQVIQEALWWTQEHPSARHFGLARYADTSDDTACEALGEMADRFRRDGPAGIRLYYITSFIEDDRCAERVDAVLLDALDTPDVIGQLRAWQSAHSAHAGRVGIGRLGTWVIDTQDEDGTRVPHSRSFQARFLETGLNALLSDTLSNPPSSVFVYAWRDRRFDRPSLGHDLSSPYLDSYGLHGITGERRLALAVVEGIYTGRQTVFAFPPGRRPSEATPWVIILGWLVLLILGLAYFRYIRFQTMVRRYFFAHGFYRESVSQGRELMFGPNALVLAALVVASGLVYGVILEAVREQPAFALLTRSLPESMVLSGVAVLGRPLTLTLVMGAIFALGVLVWTSVLSALSSRNRNPLLPGQVMMLVSWPRWTLLGTMLAAMVVSTLQQPEAMNWAIVVALATLVSGFGATFRTMNDYRHITRAGWPRLAAALAGNPFFIVILLGIYLAIRYHARVGFFLHLITRG
ncbi:MAG: hypothetical protein R2834_05585 [Rhodothermales bacterium]